MSVICRIQAYEANDRANGAGSRSAVVVLELDRRGRIEQGYRSAVMPTFGAGSNEVMRNIIATRGFGLPRA